MYFTQYTSTKMQSHKSVQYGFNKWGTVALADESLYHLLTWFFFLTVRADEVTIRNHMCEFRQEAGYSGSTK